MIPWLAALLMLFGGGPVTHAPAPAARQAVSTCEARLVHAIDYGRPPGPVLRRDCRELTRQQRRRALQLALRVTS